MKKKKWIIPAALLLLMLLAEIATRLTGIADFPTYEVSSELGYALHPNQQGKFLNKNDWQFNQKQ